MFDSLQNLVINTLQKFFKTDIRYIAKGGFWLSISNIISAIAAIAISVAFANLLPRDTYGIYKLILSYSPILIAFSLTGIGTAIVRESARGNNQALMHGFVTSLKWSFMTVILGAIFSTYYFTQDNSTFAIAFLLLGIFLPLQQAFSLFGDFLNGKKNFKYKTLIRLVYSIVLASAMISTLFLTQNVIVIMCVYFLSQILVYVYFFIKVKNAYSKNSDEGDPDFIAFSRHLSIMRALAKVTTNLDKIILFHTAGAVQLAIYTFALAPTNELTRINSIIKLLALPKLSTRDIPTLKKHLPRKVFIYFLSSAALAAFYWIAAPYLYSFLFPQYMESVFISQIGSLTILFLPFILFHKSLIVHKQTRSLYTIKITVPILRAILALTLIPIFGIIGAISTYVISAAIEAVLSTFFFLRMKEKYTP